MVAGRCWRVRATRACHRHEYARILLALAGGVFFGLDLALYNTAVMRTTATTATLFGNNSPIFVGIGTWIFFRRRPNGVLGRPGAGDGWRCDPDDRQRHAKRRGDRRSDWCADVDWRRGFFCRLLLTTEHVREEMDTLTFSTVAIAGSVLTLLVVCLILGTPLWGFRRGPGSRCWGWG